MTRTRTFDDPFLELAHRQSGDPTEVIDLAADMTEAEANEVIEAIDEVDAEMEAASIVGRLRQMGHRL